MTIPVQIEQLWVPDRLDQPDAADFLAAVNVARKVREHTWGNDDLAYTAEELLHTFHDPYERNVVLIARSEGRIGGRATLTMPLAENTHIAEVIVEILPECRGRGFGRELLAAAEQFAAGELRTWIMVETHHAVGSMPDGTRDVDLLQPACGAGALPSASREVAFAQKAGYSLEQVESFSALSLPAVSALERIPAPADTVGTGVAGADTGGRDAGRVGAARAGYALHFWTNHCPPQWVDSLAMLETRMSTDAPLAGADIDNKPWNAARVREAEELTSARGRQTMVCAVEHVPTGELAGFTAITMLGHRDDVVFQDDTLVRTEHRGHRLGLWIKAANLAQLCRDHPGVRRIYTWNASGSPFMRHINDTLGFEAAGFTGAWRKEL